MSSVYATPTTVFEDLESEVRSYCRSWPVVFDRAEGSWLYDERNRSYLDFFAGAGTLNYGHNNVLLQHALAAYLSSNRIIHSLDMYTVAKREFLESLDEVVLAPRGLEYRIQFPGPAGTNAVEAALKLARKVTGRKNVICFSNAFHGTSLGSLSVTANPLHRGAAGIPLEHTIRLPFDDARGPLDFTPFEMLLSGTGDELPAAVIVETVQGEGGVNVARDEWLAGIAARCRRCGVLLIVDDVQMGCGRTGSFFSFESAGIEPDLVCLSKSISGYGLPMALTLIRPDLDIWEPGEHNGTFRGFNLAMVTGRAALECYWRDDALELRTLTVGRRIAIRLAEIVARGPTGAISSRGRGLVHGLAFDDDLMAARVAGEAFKNGLLVERAGARDEVVKLLPPLTASDAELDHGLGILAAAVEAQM
ncbi:MAG TPA: diaminobutyrate--2-oxoglutarate transaminase [Solirubrobacteraceae bacterium]|nr:diaminobutyrate--2-oxoglutarate transaminase [Solirubrobacteraceae bacterium]